MNILILGSEIPRKLTQLTIPQYRPFFDIFPSMKSTNVARFVYKEKFWFSLLNCQNRLLTMWQLMTDEDCGIAGLQGKNRINDQLKFLQIFRIKWFLFHSSIEHLFNLNLLVIIRKIHFFAFSYGMPNIACLVLARLMQFM